MYRIGEFSVLSKTTIKTLRYYEKEGILIPSYVDPFTGYRFYETMQLIDLAKIVSLRQIGMSIDNIRGILKDGNITERLRARKEELESELRLSQEQLQKVQYLLEEKDMKYEVIIKELPAYTVYYKEGVVKDYSCISEFIQSSAQECRKTNSQIKCIEPDYCYVNYLDKEYREKDIKIRYAQAVTQMGIPNETIQFETLKPVTAVCIYHRGAYDTIGEAYGFIMKWIEENNYQITEPAREHYIDGIWNKEKVEDWLTEIQVPVTRK